MKNTARQRFAPALAGLGLISLLYAPLPAAHAQFSGGPGGGQPGGPGGFGGGQPGGPGGFGGGQPNRRPPFAAGTVTAVDSAAGTITVSSPFGGEVQTVQTQSTTKIVSQSVAAVSDLKVGDQVQIQGIPTGISASSVTIGQSPLPNPGGRGPGGPGNGGPGGGPGNGGPGGPGGGSGNGTPPVKGQAYATGTVSSTKPLTITLGQGISVTLTLAASAKVTKYTPLLLSSIKVGDRIVSSGQSNDDGTFAATVVGVNVDMGAMGMGGRGGFGGGRGGFGGGRGGGRPNGANGGGGFGGGGQGGGFGGGGQGGGFGGGPNGPGGFGGPGGGPRGPGGGPGDGGPGDGGQ